MVFRGRTNFSNCFMSSVARQSWVTGHDSLCSVTFSFFYQGLLWVWGWLALRIKMKCFSLQPCPECFAQSQSAGGTFQSLWVWILKCKLRSVRASERTGDDNQIPWWHTPLNIHTWISGINFISPFSLNTEHIHTGSINKHFFAMNRYMKPQSLKR